MSYRITFSLLLTLYNLFDQKWENGSKTEVAEEVIALYKQTLEEEYRLQFDFLDTLLIKTRRYIRFFLDNVLEMDDLVLKTQFEKVISLSVFYYSEPPSITTFISAL